MLGVRKGARNVFARFEAKSLKSSKSWVGNCVRQGLATEGCASDDCSQNRKNEEILVRINKRLSVVSLEIQQLVEGHQSEVKQLLQHIEHLKSLAATTAEEAIGASLNTFSSSPSEKSLESVSVSSSHLRCDSPSSSNQEFPAPTATWQMVGKAHSTDSAPPPLSQKKSDKARSSKKALRNKLQANLNNFQLREVNSDQRQSGRGSARMSGVSILGHDHPMQAILPDVDSMKERVREAVSKPEYCVTNFYHKTGVCQAIARHPWFELVALMVIAFNAIWVSIDVDYNHEPMLSDAEPVFQIAEHSFCAFFLAEWTIRFLSFQNKRDSLRDGWFVFDSILAFFFVCEAWFVPILAAILDLGSNGGLGNTSFLRLFRLGRLTRMGRLVRILKAVPEMLIVIKGIGVALRSVFFTLCLLTVFLYVFAISFRMLTIDSQMGKLFFTSVPSAMLSLLLGGVLPEYEETVRRIGKADLFLGFLFGAFMFISAITLMNFLIGVLVEAVSAVSATEKEQLSAKYIKSRINEFLEKSGIDKDGNRHLSKDEFEHMLLDPETALTMQEMGVDVVGLVEFGEMLFQNDNELAFPDFIRLVLRLRGTNPTTVKDIVDLRKFLLQELDSLEEYIVQVIQECMQKPEGEREVTRGPRRRTSAGNPLERLGT